jgi:hypothetical protein
MNQQQKLHLGSGVIINTDRDFNGRYWTGHARNCSMFFRDPKELTRFLRLPAGPSRESLKSWLASLEDYDNQRRSKTNEPSSDQSA